MHEEMRSDSNQQKEKKMAWRNYSHTAILIPPVLSLNQPQFVVGYQNSVMWTTNHISRIFVIV